MQESRSRNCKSCGGIVVGRSDKIFCSSDCRTEYHNIQNRLKHKYFRQVNAILKRNYNILLSLNESGKTKLKKETLEKSQFNFQYFTNTYVTKKGMIYVFVYDQGYLELSNNVIALVKKESYI